MLHFIAISGEQPPKRPAAARAGDFREVYASYAADKAAEQASRCSQCGVPFCQVHCPLANNIPDWLKLTAEGRLEEAYDLSQATNNMPEICGRICPQDRLCERNCVIEQSGHGTVTIGAIEKFLTDTAWKEGWVKPLTPRRERPQSVAVVGAGPAGLACAEQLRIKGYKVTVFDRHDRAGGLLTYGIPNFKLEKDVVRRRVKRLAAGGIKFKLNCEIGHDVPFAQLRAGYDAVFVATGAYKARDAGGPGVPALDYLVASNRSLSVLDAKDRDVAVIGGGDTAMDCVRTAIRQGARSVTCLYRRDRDNMPGSLREVVNAEEEGVAFEWLTLPKSVHGDGVRISRQRLGLSDASGRKAPQEIEGADFTLRADMVIKALGFDPEPEWKERIAQDGVFAGGDVVRGASLVVWAIRDGRVGAEKIHKYIEARTAALQAAE
ncbi:MAG TPA: NAD(P)-dependent oxidoreductase [Rhizomicrobium sp.]|jgi:glutamate synthase (NADPH/NADH) small chain|nr:NAD(P)-dependent oxidoreductase [Rhizomicrobium sp.]